jgi:CubicO group peptidase (beta-lactamase class C family)
MLYVMATGMPTMDPFPLITYAGCGLLVHEGRETPWEATAAGGRGVGMAEREGWLAAALAQVRGVEIDEAAVRAHMVRPDSLLNVHSDRGIAGALAERAVDRPPFPVPVFWGFDAAGFMALLQDALATVAGYSIGLTENGSLIGQADQNWAQWPQDGAEGWTPDTRMHVASLNKIVTAIAMTRLLQEVGLGPGTLIYDYLPEYWEKGPGIENVTFDNVMAHTSGLGFYADSPPADFGYIKSQIAAGTIVAGTDNRGSYSYQNVNYGLLRVLLATVNGNVPVDLDVGNEFADALWDCATIQAYASYVANYVFAPAGVTGPGFTHEAADALGYNFPVDADQVGWNSGPLAAYAGADGYHMSVNELLRVMAAFRRGGTIVSPAQAQAMLDAGYGVNLPIKMDTQLGPVYHKIGTWDNSSQWGFQWEQGVAFFLPLNMELVVLVNSPVAGQQDGNFLYSVVSQAYLWNIVQIPRPSEP